VTNDLRVELRTRNNILWHAIFDTHKNVRAFCAAHNLTNCEAAVGALLNLTAKPWRDRDSARYGPAGVPTNIATRLATALSMTVGELFPLDLYEDRIPRKMIAEIPSHMYRGIGAAKHLALPPSQDDDVTAREAREALELALMTLTPRERKVLRARFGLDDGEERDLDDIGKDLQVTGQRIRQIEYKALRKMRHWTRAGKLKHFVGSDCLKTTDADEEKS
jgi:RNA polymerase sigma factor (sigma-70 family)